MQRAVSLTARGDDAFPEEKATCCVCVRPDVRLYHTTDLARFYSELVAGIQAAFQGYGMMMKRRM